MPNVGKYTPYMDLMGWNEWCVFFIVRCPGYDSDRWLVGEYHGDDCMIFGKGKQKAKTQLLKTIIEIRNPLLKTQLLKTQLLNYF